MSKLFISGTNGFIGGRLVDYFITQGHYVTAFVGDIRSNSNLVQEISGHEIVLHCAAFVNFDPRNFQKALQVNVEGTRRMLQAAKNAGVRKFIHLSACAVLGYSKEPNAIISEISDFMPSKKNIYAYTKKLAEDAVLEYASQGLDACIACISTVYGRGDKKLNSGSIIKSALNGSWKFCPPGGTSYVSIEDLLEGLNLLIQKGKPAERYIFCSENLLYRELIQRIAFALGKKVSILTVPKLFSPLIVNLAALLEPFTERMFKSVNLFSSQIIAESFCFKYYNSTKAINELGWAPRVSLENSVRDAYDYYVENNLI